MKCRRSLPVFLVCFLSMVVANAVRAGRVTVNSLEELMPYLSQDHVDLVMTPGTYRITKEDAEAGKFGSPTFQKWVKALFPFSGSNSVYDFTDVTIEVETAVGQSLGSFDIYKIQTTGNECVIKNLTLLDVGSVHDAPTKGNLGVCMDGYKNRIEGLHLSTKGSYPYGYGEAFGKGGPSVVSGIKKHSAVLIRGLENHFKDCTVIHRGYGHAVFMQAANKPVIEGCYIEGEMRNSDDILAEKGTGTLGDKVNFMTYFGYPIPPGYSMCTGEEGIRAYNGGQTIVKGEIIEREAQNPTILDCTIVNMRGGVTLTHASGTKYVKGTTTIGCTRGFCIGSGTIVDCYADTSRGPALGVDYEGDSGMTAEITLLPNEGVSMNGPQYAAFITGRNHNITLKSKNPNPDQKLVIQIGGDTRHIGGLGKVSNYSAGNITINNQTAHPIWMGDRVENCSVTSGGLVTDLGKNNTVTHTPVTQLEVVAEKPKSLSQGEDAIFEINIPVAGSYWVDYQFEASGAGSFSVASDDQSLEVVNVSAGKETARSKATLHLSEGEQTLKVTSAVDGLKLKGFSFMLEYPDTPVVPHTAIYNAMGDLVRETIDDQITIFPGHALVINPEPRPDLGGRWSWTGPNGFSSENRTLELSVMQEKRAGTYTATFENSAGIKSSRSIEIKVQDMVSIPAEENVFEYPVHIPVTGMYVIGSRISSKAPGSFVVKMDGTQIDEVAFESTAGEWKTVSSGTPVYLQKGKQVLSFSDKSDALKLEWIKLKARGLVRSNALPIAYKPEEIHAFDPSMIDSIDISNEGPVDVYVMYKNRKSLKSFYQIDGGESVPLKQVPSSKGRTLAAAMGLTGDVLTLNIKGRDQSDYHAIEGIYISKSRDPFARIEADDFADNKDTRVENTQDEGGGYNVGSIRNGSWLKYSNVNLIGAKQVHARVANIYNGGSVEVRLASPDGPVIAKLDIPKTGGWQNWKTVSGPVKSVAGIYDLYLVFGAESNAAGNINWFEFSK